MPENAATAKQLSELEKIYLKDLLDRRSKSEENLLQAIRAAGIAISVLCGFVGQLLFRSEYAPLFSMLSSLCAFIIGVLLYGFGIYMRVIRQQRKEIDRDLLDQLARQGMTVDLSTSFNQVSWHLRWMGTSFGLLLTLTPLLYFLLSQAKRLPHR